MALRAQASGVLRFADKGICTKALAALKKQSSAVTASRMSDSEAQISLDTLLTLSPQPLECAELTRALLMLTSLAIDGALEASFGVGYRLRIHAGGWFSDVQPELDPRRATRFGSTRFKAAQEVRSLDLSRDGSLLAVGTSTVDQYGDRLAYTLGLNSKSQFSGHCELRLWNLPSGELRFRHLLRDSEIRHVAISPDKTRVAAATRDGHLALFDVEAARPLCWRASGKRFIHRIDFSPDSTLLVVSGEPGKLTLWNSSDGSPAGMLPIKGSAHFSFAHDTGLLFVGEYDRPIEVWDIQAKAKVYALEGSENKAGMMSVSDAGDLLVLQRNPDLILQTISGKTLTKLTTITVPDRVSLSDSQLSGARACLAYCTTSDANVNLVDVRQGGDLPPLRCHGNAVTGTLRFSADARRVARTFSRRAPFVFDLGSHEELSPAQEPASPIRTVALSADASLLAVGCSDYSVHLFLTENGTRRHMLVGHTNTVDTMAFSAKGTLLATGASDSTVRIWDTTLGACLHVLEVKNDVHTVLFAPNSEIMLVYTWTTLFAFDAKDGALLWERRGSVSTRSAFDISPDGTKIFAFTGLYSAAVLDTQTGRCLVETDMKQKNFTYARIMRDDTVLLADAHSAQTRSLTTTEVSPLVSLSSDESWDLVSPGPDGNVLGLSSDGSRAVGAAGRTLVVWDVKSGNPISVHNGHIGAINTAIFSNDDRKIVSGSDDCTAVLWTLD